MPSFDTRVPAVLVRLDPNPFHHGTLGAARSLGRAGVAVHAVVESLSSPVVRSRYLRGAHLRPVEPSPAELTRLLLRVADQLRLRPADGASHSALLVPLDDITALSLAECRPELAGRYLLPDQSPEQLARVADKAQLAETCRSLGLPHPRTELPTSAEEAAAMAWSLGLPVIAKWSRPWLLPVGGRLRSTTIVGSLAEVRELYERTPQAGSRLLLQELLPAGRDLDWFFHGYVDSGGGCSTGATGRKERSWPDGAGLTAVGRWTANPAVDTLARELLAALGYRGVCDLDFRLDRATGAYHLLDFNPRPGAQFRLFADRDGLDVVRAMHLDLTGRAVPAHLPLYGRRFVVENYAALSYVSSPGRRYAPEPRTAGGGAAGEAAWFAADDLGPALAMLRGWVSHLLRKGLLTLRRGLRGAAGRPRWAAAVPPPSVRDRGSTTPSDRMPQR
ncbi:ATP-grasp domain-containing protein [Streptomyces sp. NPDC004267]|uniref:carboxylate--amine ligase n=1 Tax=Streptomyces sp. NPDC004267 TaxID=3364694 RepID=UPI0036753016